MHPFDRIRKLSAATLKILIPSYLSDSFRFRISIAFDNGEVEQFPMAEQHTGRMMKEVER